MASARKRRGRSSNGTGTITKRSATSFEVKYTYKDVTGKSKRKSKYFKTRAEAESFRLAIANEIMSGNYKDAGTLTVGGWCKFWFETYNNNVRPSTKSNYEGYINNKIIPFMGDKKLEKLTTNDLQVFFNTIKAQGNIKTDGPLSDKTVKNIYQMLHCCLGQAVENDLIRKNFCDGVELPSQDVKEEARVLNKEEREKIFFALDNCNDLIVRKNEQLHLEKSSTRYATDTLGYRYAIYVALYTGARIGEVMALQWKDVDFNNNTISIRKSLGRHKDYNENAPAKTILEIGNTKNTESRRSVPMPEKLRDKLLEHKAEQKKLIKNLRETFVNKGYVFANVTGNPIETRTIQDFFKKLLMIADVDDGNLHCLRHTFATKWLESQRDIKTLSAILGHSSSSTVQTTLKVYAHALEEHKAEQMLGFDY